MQAKTERRNAQNIAVKWRIPGDVFESIFYSFASTTSFESALLVCDQTTGVWGIDFKRARQLFRPKAIGFRSSGTGGRSRVSWRTHAQIEIEAALIREIGLVRAPKRIICAAPIHHIFGFICGLELAHLFNAEFVFVPQNEEILNFLSDDPREALLITIPTTWHVLARSRQFQTLMPRLQIIHSAGPLPIQFQKGIRSLIASGMHLCELFGSTETGAVAARTGTPGDTSPWWLLPDVEIDPHSEVIMESGQVMLQVSSPRCAFTSTETALEQQFTNRASSVQTGDVVTLLKSNAFCFEGPGIGRVKIAGVTVQIDMIENILNYYLNPVEMMLYRFDDPVRGGALGILVKMDRSEPTRIMGVEATIRRLFRRLCGPSVYPMRITYVEDLPTNVSGKPLRMSAANDSTRDTTFRDTTLGS